MPVETMRHSSILITTNLVLDKSRVLLFLFKIVLTILSLSSFFTRNFRINSALTSFKNYDFFFSQILLFSTFQQYKPISDFPLCTPPPIPESPLNLVVSLFFFPFFFHSIDQAEVMKNSKIEIKLSNWINTNSSLSNKIYKLKISKELWAFRTALGIR